MNPSKRYSGLHVATRGAIAFAAVASFLVYQSSSIPARADSLDCPGPSTPTLAAGVYSIDDSSHLQWVKATTAAWDDSFIQTANIDMGGCVWDTGIGAASSGFSGDYNGGGHEVRGLDVNTLRYAAGLFEKVTGTVRNLGFTGDVTGTNTTDIIASAGGLVGRLDGGTITNSYATGDVSSAYSNSSDRGTGGLVGTMVGSSSITDSHATGAVDANAYAGGLVGAATTGSKIQRSYSTGNVTVTFEKVGGFASILAGTNVSESYATGIVTANGTGTTPGQVIHVGGFAGDVSNAQITDSYSTGKVVGGNQQVGGFVGDLGSAGSVTLKRVFSLTDDTAGGGLVPMNTFNETGAFAGYRFPSVSVSGALFNNQTSVFGDDSAIGSGLTTGIKGRSTAQLNNILTYTDDTAGWNWNATGNIIASGYDSNYTWGICAAVNNGYPFLTGTYAVNPCASAPTAPQNPVATGGNASATVTWAAPVSDGGSALTGYTVTASPGGQTCTDDTVAPLSCVVTGLTNGTSYTFDVTATNGVGTSAAATSNAVTPVAPTPPTPPTPTKPGAPTNVSGVAGDGQVAVTWQAPADSGTYPITDYQVTASPGGATCLVAAPTLACTVDGLTNDTAYTFTVKALSGAGWGPDSAPSPSVTPVAPRNPTITITGSRSQDNDKRVYADGITTDLVGEVVQARVHLAGEEDYYNGSRRTVSEDGTFRWTRKTNKKVYLYFRHDETRSNRIVISPR